MTILSEKIHSLGGIEKEKLPGISNRGNAIYEQKIEQEIIPRLPQSLKEFSTEFGSFSFSESIVAKGVDEIAFAGGSNKVDVELFYDYTRDSVAIAEILNTYEEQIPPGLLPIFDSTPGDFICIDINSGAIYFWHHEGGINKNKFLVANNFEEFIVKLEIEREEDRPQDEMEIIKVTYSPEFLALLGRNGYGPKD